MTTSPPGGSFTPANTDLALGRMGYGAMQLPGPHVWGPPRDHDAAIAVLRDVVALGANHIDTAHFYGPGVANDLIREALSPYPDTLTIVTKVGFVRGDDASWRPDPSRAGLTKAIDDNLATLGVDALDVVNLRLADADSAVAEPLDVLVGLRDEGLIRHIGLSNATAAQYDAARAITPIMCVQNQYNLVQRGDDALIDTLADDGVAYVPFFPLGGFTPLQSSMLSDVAAELGASPKQVALAWLLQRSPNILVIAGTSSAAHLRENFAAAELALSAEQVETLDRIGG